jgi:hypothetical protein
VIWFQDATMIRLSSASVLACAGLLALRMHPALAHAVCGSRVFPVTLTIDDPGVADEASLPTFTYQRSGADGGPGPTHEYDFNFEYDKRITTNLGVGVNYGWNVHQTEHAKTQTGFSNLFVTVKYQTCVSPDHEFIATVGLQREFGRTGTAHTGADEFGATTPTLYFGKGLGDLPIPLLRPFAITGELSYAVADKALKAASVTDPSTGLMSLQSNNGNSNRWFGGVSLQYSIPYLQTQVKDYGLPPFIGRLTPLVEVTWSSPATAPSSQGTTWTIAPGVIYSGDAYQIGVEALIPANRAAGTNVGIVAQFHVFLDDLFPNSLGRPLFDF